MYSKYGMSKERLVKLWLNVKNAVRKDYSYASIRMAYAILV